jgi:hypothetical protein
MRSVRDPHLPPAYCCVLTGLLRGVVFYVVLVMIDMGVDRIVLA